ncbi:homoserine kinase [Apilactobacillus apisilvae]|uniref:Homoserine kinase n=1 Tax=Apilactobacillus apisilvae TaxID=2923364 RepID=A0ABY4PHD8_9LACO|nr:homoserine kinase [Apilactobacillus apisilvae]UQS85027.1 homoserine kinase [Apilactobacillus apisilvae]
MDKKLIVRVPSTSSNLGAGFNSLGIAFHLYYTVIVEEEMDEWQVNHALGDDIPHDENNLIVQTILSINSKIHPHQLTVMSDVPMERGMGSSTTAVVAGIKIANALGDMDLSLDQQINIGSKIEGHPENVTSAILGDLTISTFDGDMCTTVKASMPKNINVLMFIKNKESTKPKRPLPKTIKFNDAIQSSSFANVFVASVMSNEWSKAAEMIERDKFHEHYREKDVPELNIIRKYAHEIGIRGTYISGCGPTIATFGTESELNKLRDVLNNHELDGNFRLLKIDYEGASVRGE